MSPTKGTTDKPPPLFVVTPAGFGKHGISPREAERQLARYMREHHSLAYEHEDDAIDAALMAASSAEDNQAWALQMGPSLGMTDCELDQLRIMLLPRSFAYAVKLQFYDVVIEEIDDCDWESSLGASADLLSLPEAVPCGAEDEPRRQFRVVATEDLLGRFGIIKATKVLARPRRRL